MILVTVVEMMMVVMAPMVLMRVAMIMVLASVIVLMRLAIMMMVMSDGYDSSEDDDHDDSDFLTLMLHNTKEEILVGNAKGLANFKTLKKSADENMYKRSKGCPKHWIMVLFVLELLILKVKHGWYDGSFNDVLCT
jgi:hypothetical protein